MAYSFSTAPGGGGGGGIVIQGWQQDDFVQEENFAADTVTLALTQTPVSNLAITVDYNGQRLNQGSDWEYDAINNEIDILFGDPYVTSYDQPPVFQVVYPYL